MRRDVPTAEVRKIFIANGLFVVRLKSSHSIRTRTLRHEKPGFFGGRLGKAFPLVGLTSTR